MSYRCPQCKSEDRLYELVDVPGWIGIDSNLERTGEHDIDSWSDAQRLELYGCSACGWDGGKLETVL